MSARNGAKCHVVASYSRALQLRTPVAGAGCSASVPECLTVSADSPVRIPDSEFSSSLGLGTRHYHDHARGGAAAARLRSGSPRGTRAGKSTPQDAAMAAALLGAAVVTMASSQGPHSGPAGTAVPKWPPTFNMSESTW